MSYPNNDAGRSFKRMPPFVVPAKAGQAASFRLSKGGIVLSWNYECEQLYGYTPPEIVGKPFTDLVPWEHRSETKLEQLLSLVENIGSYVSETWALRRNGGRFWCALRLSAQFDEYFDVTATDLMESLLGAERFLCWRNASASYYKQAVVMLGPDGRVTGWDDRATEMLGYRLEEVLGQPFMDLFPSDSRCAGDEERELAIAIRTGMSESIHKCLRKSGQSILLFIRLRLLKDTTSGCVAGLYAIFTQLGVANQNHGDLIS
jgi:PAS domain S-box-containing protein